MYTISGESCVSKGEELKEFGSIDDRPNRRIRNWREGKKGLPGERPVGSNNALPTLSGIDASEEDLSVDINVEHPPAVGAGVAAVLEVECNVVEPSRQWKVRPVQRYILSPAARQC